MVNVLSFCLKEYSLYFVYDIEEWYNIVIYDRVMKFSIIFLLFDIRFFIFFNFFEDIRYFFDFGGY